MHTQLVQPRRSRQTEPRASLVSCSICLRVLRGSEWIEAERAIRALRSYELDAPPRLEPGLCDLCAHAIGRRRARVSASIAA
jgi:hypothetical protein